MKEKASGVVAPAAQDYVTASASRRNQHIKLEQFDHHGHDQRLPMSVYAPLIHSAYIAPDTDKHFFSTMKMMPYSPRIVDNESKIRTIREVGMRRLHFSLMVMLSIAALANFDHGAIPAVLGQLQSEFPLGYVEQSLLASLVYFGLIVGTLLAGVLFQRMNAQWILVASGLGISLFLYIFSQATNLGLMYVSRFFSGFFQALPIVYLPVWIDDHSPENTQTRWMSYFHLASIAGTVSGYIIGGVSSHWDATPATLAKFSTSWRTPFFIQAILVLVTVILLAWLPSCAVDLPASSIDAAELSSSISVSSDATGGILKSCVKRISKLLKNPLYVVLTFGMSNLYFVFTGIQFWITAYMVEVFHLPKIGVVYALAACFLTAPLIGVWFGGYIGDLCGGYRGARTEVATRVAAAFSGLASISACVATQLDAVLWFSLSLWFTLFFGSSLVPVAAGIALSHVPPLHRSLSSAVSQLAYNLFGWFAAPLLSGAVMDFIAAQPQTPQEYPLKMGFHLILLTSVFGFLLFLFANCLVTPAVDDSEEGLEFHVL